MVETPPAEGGTQHAHPSEWEYIKIVLILAAITAAEVAFYYFEMLEGILPPILIIMSIIKFVIVVL